MVGASNMDPGTMVIDVLARTLLNAGLPGQGLPAGRTAIGLPIAVTTAPVRTSMSSPGVLCVGTHPAFTSTDPPNKIESDPIARRAFDEPPGRLPSKLSSTDLMKALPRKLKKKQPSRSTRAAGMLGAAREQSQRERESAADKYAVSTHSPFLNVFLDGSGHPEPTTHDNAQAIRVF
jgi:hypothetical protein